MGPSLYFSKMSVNLPQYHGITRLFNSRSIANRFQFNNFITLNYNNKTYTACSLISANKIPLLLFSVWIVVKKNVSKNNRQFFVLILFSSTFSSSSSCINLVLTSQPNLIVDSGNHPSLHSNCNHQIIYVKFNLKIRYPQPYTREVWHYKGTNDHLIRSAINQFNC